jgi:uncharacterized repeat protein (TIGR01451 family)
MNIQHFYPKKIFLSLAILVALLLSSLPFVVSAQNPAPFEITVIPAADFAVSGQPFTYTVVITNVSETAIENVAIKSETPKGTTFVGTEYKNVDWAVRRPDPGGVGEVLWYTQTPVDPGEVVDFDLVFLPETGQEIINEGYTIIVGSLDNLVASSPDILTEIVTPTPSPSPTPIPPTTTSLPPTATPTSLPEETPTQLPDVAQVVTQTVSSSPSPAATPTEEGQTTSFILFSSTILLIMAGIIVFVFFIGLIWFIRRK